jgi:MFS family permease
VASKLPSESPPSSEIEPGGFFLWRLYPSLANAEFRLLWLGMLPATMAWQMSVITSGYAALLLSGSATAIGLVSLATGLPMLVLSPVGGVVADRFPRRRVLFASQTVLGLATAALAALALGGRLQVWHLALLGLAQAAAFSFNMPARQAYIAELVGSQLLRNAVALNNAGMNLCRIAGPALAGGLLAVPAIGIGGVFSIMTGLYCTVLATLLRLPDRQSSDASDPSSSSDSGWQQLVEGLRYVRSRPALMTLMGLAFAVLMFGMPFIQLMPVFSEREFEVGAAGLGVLMAANGVGALLGSLSVAALSSFSRPAVLQAILGVSFGLTLVGFALAPFFALAVALVALVGFSSMGYIALNNSLVIANSEARLHGRVMSIYLLTFAVMPVAALPMAWLADQVGIRATVAGAGFIVAAIAGAVSLYRPYREIR